MAIITWIAPLVCLAPWLGCSRISNFNKLEGCQASRNDLRDSHCPRIVVEFANSYFLVDFYMHQLF